MKTENVPDRREYARKWRSSKSKEWKDKQNARCVAWKYSISVDAYIAIIASGCTAAALGATECSGPIGVDHDHLCCPGKKSCGKCIRGALCLSHNLAEGHYDRAKSWVESYRSKHR